jgi:hypothetical protein
VRNGLADHAVARGILGGGNGRAQRGGSQRAGSGKALSLFRRAYPDFPVATGALPLPPDLLESSGWGGTVR